MVKMLVFKGGNELCLALSLIHAKVQYEGQKKNPLVATFKLLIDQQLRILLLNESPQMFRELVDAMDLKLDCQWFALYQSNLKKFDQLYPFRQCNEL